MYKLHQEPLSIMSIMQVFISLSSDEEDLIPLQTMLESRSCESVEADKVKGQMSAVETSPCDELICQICLNNRIDCIFYTCGHMYCCNICALRLGENSNCCPVCRAEVQQVVKVYR